MCVSDFVGFVRVYLMKGFEREKVGGGEGGSRLARSERLDVKV